MLTDKEEIKKCLDAKRSFQEDSTLTKEQAEAIDKASKRPPSKIKGRELPSRLDKNQKSV